MPESERRQRVISSTPRLSPDDIAQRSFGSSFRGYAETEVRAFLKRVADEVSAAREREQELTEALDDVEEQLRAPRPLDEQQLLDVLGEETARLLRTAREASDDIRRKAEERAASVMEEAQAEAHRLRTEAAEILSVRTSEAEAAAADIIGEAEARAAELRASNERAAEDQRQRAETEAAAIVEDARQQGREMLDEARSARERVLNDLGRRRNLLQAQVEELRQGRDRLLEAYRVVKRTFLDATEALAHVEARAASERALAPGPDYVASEMAVTETDSDRVASETVVLESQTAEGEIEVVLEEVNATDAESEAPVESASPPELADVDSLFARIRAGQAEPPAEPDAPVTATDGPEAAPEITLEEPPAPAEAGGAGADEAAPATGATGATGATEAAEAWRARHLAAVDPLLAPLVKRAKRAAQDDQNALLDAVRRHKGRPSAAQVLRDDDALVAGWTDVMRSALDAAYRAGREAAGATAEAAPDDLLREAAETIALPLRDRIAAAIDDVDGGDTSGLVERIGARYREWKNQQLERALGDAMVVAWSRGVYDGTAGGSVLQWIPLVVGHCADCDDNALEPTVKGEVFPTGQARPPAHPGCRCLLAPAGVLVGPTPG
jgi:DivIVA domain-containing protein